MLSWLNEGNEAFFHGWDRLVQQGLFRNYEKHSTKTRLKIPLTIECFRFSFSPSPTNAFETTFDRTFRFVLMRFYPRCLPKQSHRVFSVMKTDMKLSSINYTDNDEREFRFERKFNK